MKTTILILSIFLLASCNKSKTQPVVQPTPIVNTPTGPTSNTITINFDPSSTGYIYINWNYKQNQYTPDSLYHTTNSMSITRVLTSDTIRYRFYSTSCSSCGSDPSNLTIYKNGLLVNTFANDFGGNFRYLILN